MRLHQSSRKISTINVILESPYLYLSKDLQRPRVVKVGLVFCLFVFGFFCFFYMIFTL